MQDDDRRYFESRAEEELEQAQQSDHPNVVRAHYQLAGFYLDKVFGAGSSDPAQIGLC